jgi:phosphoglycolate phosphatase-like HAD superfamily hydrolase
MIGFRNRSARWILSSCEPCDIIEQRSLNQTRGQPEQRGDPGPLHRAIASGSGIGKPPFLALFDLDGTLLLSDGNQHGSAVVAALRDVYGVRLPHDAVARIRPWGKTDPRIAREVLQAAGVHAKAIDRRLGEWADAAASRFRRLVEKGTTEWILRSGAAETLSALEQSGVRLALVTGNLERIARMKVSRLSLERFFPAGQGAFGSDDERREALVALARRRAGQSGNPWPRSRTVIVGDTPHDVAAASTDGVRCIVVPSGFYGRGEFPESTVIVQDLPQVIDVMGDLRATGRS